MNFNTEFKKCKTFEDLEIKFKKLDKEFKDEIKMLEEYSKKLRYFQKDDLQKQINTKIEKKYLKLIDNKSYDFKLHCNLSIFYEWIFKDYKKAIEVYKGLLKNVNKKDFDEIVGFYTRLANCYKRIEDFDKAISVKKQHIEFLKKNDIKESNSQYKDGNNANSKLGEQYRFMGHLFYELNDERLVKFYKTAFKYESSNIIWYSNVAAFYFKNNDFNNYQKYMDLLIDSDISNLYSPRKFDARGKILDYKVFRPSVKSYILELYRLGEIAKSIKICESFMVLDHDDIILSNIYLLLVEYGYIKKKLTKSKFDKLVKSKQKRFKVLKKKLNEFIKSKPSFKLNIVTPYTGNDYFRNLIVDNRSRSIQRKLIKNALIKLDNDIFLVADLFQTSLLSIMNEYININKAYLKN
jgi:hypothetical protein